MKQIELVAEIREGTGKGVTRKLRVLGKIPAVVYGREQNPTPITLESKGLTDLLATGRAMRTLVTLKMEGSKEFTKKIMMFREIQRHHISRAPLAADLMVVDPNTPITLPLPLILTGSAIGLISGGVVQQLIRRLNVMAAPTKLPDGIELDISDLDAGDTAYLSDLKVPDGVTLIGESNTPVATVAIPRGLGEDEAEKEEGEEGAEGEEIAEGEKAEEGAGNAKSEDGKE